MPVRNPLVVPQINLNGNTAESLIKELIEVRHQLFKLMGTMRAVSHHHGRNFQTMTDPAKSQALARAAWDERVADLLTLYAELGTLAEAIQAQTKTQFEHHSVQ